MNIEFISQKGNFIHSFVKKWGTKVSFSLIDQAVYSGTNFVINILLIRWLSPENYGAYAVAFTVFLICSGFYNAAILEPMSVLGPSAFKHEIKNYLSFLLLIHIYITLSFSAIGFIIALVFYSSYPELFQSFLGLAGFFPFLLIIWFFRQGCYVYSAPQRALLGSCLYSLLAIGGLFLIKSINLTLFSAFAIIGFSGAIASLLFWPERSVFGKSLSALNPNVFLGKYLKVQWKYAKWVAGTAVMYALANQIYPIFLAINISVVEAGIFRALQYIILPLQQFNTALFLLFLPSLSRDINFSHTTFIKKIVAITCLAVFTSVIYVGTILFFDNKIVGTLYGSVEFTSYTWMFPYFGVTSIISALILGLGLYSRAMKRPDGIFWSNLASVLIVFTFGLTLISDYKMQGVVITMTLSSLTTLIILILFVFKIGELNKDNERNPQA
jgi:O-antigen/teichoic acid export membrane protein